MDGMRFIDADDGRYVSVADLITMLIEFTPVVRDKAGMDWPVTSIIAYVMECDLRSPARTP